MKEQLVTNMKALLLSLFAKMPGLSEGYCLAPMWQMMTEIQELNQLEIDAFNVALDECIDSGIIELKESKSSRKEELITITRAGVELITNNKLRAKEEKNKESQNISIGSLNAENVQLGNENVMNINVTPDEFVVLLKTLTTKPEAEKTSIFSILSDLVKTGVSVGGLLIKLKALL